MANIKDFAVGLVVTPPSPATTGTTLTLRTGEGATMPTPPFYVTAGPPGELTTIATSEKLLVTAVAGDVLTIVRGQTPTTAKSIAVNWIVANALYTEDVVGYVAQPSAPTNTNVLWYDTDDTADGTTGNHADTVDGFHASATPTANYIPVLNSTGKMPLSTLSTGIIGTPATSEVSSAGFTTTEITLLTYTITITQEMINSGRKFKLTAFIPQLYASAAGSRARVTIYDGATVMTRTYQSSTDGVNMAFTVNISTPSISMPSLGSHTYTLKAVRDAGTGTFIAYAEAGDAMYLEAEIK